MPSRRIGLGPIFAFERIAASRRWQGYALRSFVVSSLFVAVVLVWLKTNSSPPVSAIRYVATLGRGFFVAVMGTQLALVLLAAPAATAGAICLDRARGTLSHMLMTDLSAFEIVLGKLASRLLPVLSFLVCALPMTVILALLGGVDPAALLNGFVVAASVAVLGCSLAMFMSLYHKKTHEALLATYAALGVWLLVWPGLELLTSRTGWFWLMPSRKIEPFFMAVAPYLEPGAVSFADYLWFAGAVSAISVQLVAVTALRVRAVCTREQIKKRKLAPSSVQRGNIWRMLNKNIPWLTPSLDGNPVVWREWHRERPTCLKLALTWIYIAVAAASSALAVWFSEERELGAIVNGFQVAFGLLLLGVWGATSLAEERARGSLDLLLCTPLSTSEIVTGKWLGTFRSAPLLAVLPGFVIGANAYITEQNFVFAACLMAIYVLCAGAAVISLGILMATRFSRVGRAVSVTVALYAFVAVAWLFIVITLSAVGGGWRQMAVASPFFWAGTVTFDFSSRLEQLSFDVELLWIGISFVCAVVLLDLARCDFDRRLGRVDDSAASLGWPSMPARVAALGYVGLAALAASCVLPQDWMIAAAVLFAVGSILTSVIAASTSSVSHVVVVGLLPASLSPEPLLIRKWSIAFRYALMFDGLVIMFMVIHAGPQLGLWKQFVVAGCYLLSVSAAATSLGVAMFTRFPRSPQAVLFAVLLSALAIIPWFSLERLSERTALGEAVASIGPLQAIRSLDRAGINANHYNVSAIACATLGIAVHAGTAVLVLWLARETARRSRSDTELAVTMQRASVPPLTAQN